MPRMNDRLLFYHVPKTGGRWVVMVAGKRIAQLGLRRVPTIRGIHPYELRGLHLPPLAVSDKYKKDRFQFCFVRRPYEWYRSFWCYRFPGRKSIGRYHKRLFVLDKCWDDEFEPFLENVLAAYPDGFLTQFFQCYVGPDNTWMDFVGRQENLRDDLVTALTLAGESSIDEKRKRIRRLKPINVHGGLPQFRDLAASPSMIERIENAEHWVLETFYRVANEGVGWGSSMKQP